MTGMGWMGRSCFKKSIPLMPGISTSEVITSGLNCSTLAMASFALKAVATTSIWGEVDSPLEIMVRAKMESSTTRTRTLRLEGRVGMVEISPLTSGHRSPRPAAWNHFFWKVEGATVT